MCDEGLKTFAHMAVASYIGCTWCLDFNYFEARNKDVDMDKAREVPRWRESDVFTPLEREVMALRRGDEPDAGHRHRRDGREPARTSSATRRWSS